MTATGAAAGNPAPPPPHQAVKQAASSSSKPQEPSVAFQQVKQTQASLARLSRAQQQLSSNSSQPAIAASKQVGQQQSIKCANTFVDCLIRRFKDCFNKDSFSVPMFVVGSLSPGSDGTHLILPPCVSLGGQNISRFASPKNLRLMNSIRESCRSIEELDLGGNKLNDLIEVYKILQCTPNLKFLNLSENDLSRSSPVAMAATCAGAQPNLSAHPSVGLSNGAGQSNNYPSNAINLSSRTCLGSLNQNQQQQAFGSRRHSSLSQSATRQSNTRAAEARRLTAAANAVAQSKKTSSSMANLLTQSSRSTLLQKTGRRSLLGAQSCEPNQPDQAKPSVLKAGRIGQMATTSTMHLARSLSSLSSKDIRASSSSLNRISNQRQITRRVPTALKEPIVDSRSNHTQVQQTRSTAVSRINQSTEPQTTGNQNVKWQQACSSSPPSCSSSSSPATRKPPATKSSKLFTTEPIEESEDVDMNQQQQADINQELNQKPVPAVVNSTRSLHQIGLNSPPKPTMTSPATNYTTNYRRTFKSIKALALNNTGCQWRVVCSILSRMPNLEELHLSLNNYERVDLDPNEFTHPALKRLYLCSNPKLTSWEELDKLLLAFPSLEALSIAHCSISQIPDNLGRALGWRKLCGLNINGWPIKEWPVVERLNQLPSLIDLRCRDLDVLNNIDEPRHHLIARLPKLQRLNGSEIEEREHAEKAFLRFFMSNSHLERPPRFHELIQIYGEVSPVDVDVDLSPPNHASVKVIYLNKSYYSKENDEDIFMSEEFLNKIMDNTEPPQSAVSDESSLIGTTQNMEISTNEATDKPVRLFKDESQEVVAIDIDLRQSVRKFKTTIASLFGLESRDVILYYIDHEMVGLMGPELIKHNQKKLWNYNVQDGDHFIVEER